MPTKHLDDLKLPDPDGSNFVRLKVGSNLTAERVVTIQMSDADITFNPGTAGAAGPTGSQGPPGTQGTTGAAGAQGQAGPAGSQGPPGTQGTTGATGVQGTQGPQGITGLTGSTGNPGTQGTAGTQGPVGSGGPPGATGAAGNGRNLIINGGFWFFQRTGGTITTVTSEAYGPDRWRMIAESTIFRCERVDSGGTPVTAGMTSRYYGQFTKSTSAGKVQVCQPIEGADIMHLQGRQVTLCGRMMASAAMTKRLGLLYLNSSGTVDTIPATIVSAWGGAGVDPSLGTNLARQPLDSIPSGASGSVVGAGVNCSLTTSWQLFAGTFTVPANCRNLIPAVWSNAQMAVADYFMMAEFGLYEGAAVQAWAPLAVPSELARVKRFARPGGAGAAGRFQGTTTGEGAFSFEEMRTTPNAALISTTPSFVEIGVGPRVGTASAIVGGSTVWTNHGGRFGVDGFGATSGAMFVCDADFVFLSAEL